jgi:hypothetical protein
MENAAVYVLLAIVIAMITVFIPLFVRGMTNTHSQCDKINDREIIVETKLDMLLEIAGFDNHKVNRAIKEHMEELKKNSKPSVGCINIEELYRTKPGG